MIKKIVSLMILSLCFLSSFGVYADASITSSAIINTVAATSVIDDPVDEQNGSSLPSTKKKDYTVGVGGGYLLTICTESQAQTALAWQTLCRAGHDFQNGLCPVISYQRYCEPATAKDVKGLKPLKPVYQNIFLKE